MISMTLKCTQLLKFWASVKYCQGFRWRVLSDGGLTRPKTLLLSQKYELYSLLYFSSASRYTGKTYATVIC
jgi:hypothetical protein